MKKNEVSIELEGLEMNVKVEVANPYDFEAYAQMICEEGLFMMAFQDMDEELVEEVGNKLRPCSRFEFLEEYLKRHYEKYDSYFVLF